MQGDRLKAVGQGIVIGVVATAVLSVIGLDAAGDIGAVFAFVLVAAAGLLLVVYDS